tara:strand:+ start:680 stop:1012 length:333 start_codon:yes stop_codon:yes gene_type:complete
MAKSVKRSRRNSNNTRRNSNNNNGRNTNSSKTKSNKGKGRSVKRKKGSKGKGKNSKVQRGCMRGGHLASYRFHQNQGFLNRINPNAHSKPLTYFADNVVEDHSNQYSLSH